MRPAGHRTLRYDGTCVTCRASLRSGDRAWYDPGTHTVECGACRPEPSVAGGSAQRVADRKLATRDRNTRERHPVIGGLLMKVREVPQQEKAWNSGARGERRIGGVLDGLVGPGLQVIHDRRMPRSNANIDHLVVTRSGIYVVDAKRYVDKLIRLRLGRRGPDALEVGGSPSGNLVNGVGHQVEAVRGAIDLPVAITGVLCFTESRWPPFESSFIVSGVLVCHPQSMQKTLRRKGPLTDEGIVDLRDQLLRRFRAA